MFRITLASRNDIGIWRDSVRPLLAARVAPEHVAWSGPDDPAGLWAEKADVPDAAHPVVVPSGFFTQAEAAICHSDPRRFDLLYRLAFRLQDEKTLLDIASDPDVMMLARFGKSVHRDSHKMTAFVRFRAVDDSGERFAAWFEPDHFTLERTAWFFAERFAGMDWAILTPYRSVVWDRKSLAFGEGARKADVPPDDALETAWRTYFSSIFNPARLKISAMTAEMPRKYWRNLPEAEVIDGLIRSATVREKEMIASAASQPPSRHLRQAARAPLVEAQKQAAFASLGEVEHAIDACRRCPLYQQATQPVFGEGPKNAAVMIVGEQPGDSEDLAGKPFVGPAGRVFDAALDAARIDRKKLYVTNAVKHFKFVPRGKRRLHQAPSSSEVSACKFWIDQEMEQVGPKVVVAMGATAARSLLGPKATIGRLRGAPIEMGDGRFLFVTVHPSYLLRLPDREKAAQERAAFVADLAMIGDFVQSVIGQSVALDSGGAGP